MNLKFKRLHEAAQLPTRANPTDSGMDLYAVEDTVLLPGVPTLVKTGLAVEIRSGGDIEYASDSSTTVDPVTGHRSKWITVDVAPITFEAQIRPRSGLALKHGIQVLGGTVDNGYRNEIGVILLWGGHAPNEWRINNFFLRAFGRYRIRRGDRIAQLVIAPVVLCGAEWASELGATDRGEAGFGSTGK